jgi:hypothetical protein
MDPLDGFTFANNLVDATGASVGSFNAVGNTLVHHNLWSSTAPAALADASDIVDAATGLSDPGCQAAAGAFDLDAIRLSSTAPGLDQGAIVPEVTRD